MNNGRTVAERKIILLRVPSKSSFFSVHPVQITVTQFIRRSVALNILRNTPGVSIISNDFKQFRSKEENMENRHSTRLIYL